jgi:hexosaminidase
VISRFVTACAATVLAATGSIVAVAPPAVATTNQQPALVPTPTSWQGGHGTLRLTRASRIVVAAGQALAVTTGPASPVLVGQRLGDVAHELQTDLGQLGLDLRVVVGGSPAGAGDIALTLTGTRFGVEGYDLDADSGVRITASTTSGAYWGTRTLLQLLSRDPSHRAVPRGTIHDAPSLPLRVYMLDMARKYWQPHYIYDLIRQMSYLKMNVLNMHLDDAEGFRLNSPRYPGLADPATSYDERQIRQFVEFGRQHNVLIMPGFEMPGHSTAVDEYFKIGIGDGANPCPPGSVNEWVTPDFVMDLTQPKTLATMTRLLETFGPWFDAPWVHVGADEVPDSVATCPRIAAYLQAHPEFGGLAGLANSFLNRVDDVVRGMHRQTAIYSGVDLHAAVPLNPNILITDWTGAGSKLAGYPIVHEPVKAYLTPNNLFNLYPDVSYLYSTWTPDNDDGVATLGGAMSVWTDYVYWGEDSYYENFAALPRAVVALRTWNSAVPASTLAQFTQSLAAVGSPPGYRGDPAPAPVRGNRPVHYWTFERAPLPPGYPHVFVPGYVLFYKDYAGGLNGSSYIEGSPTTVPGVQGEAIHATRADQGIGLGGTDLPGPWTLSFWVRRTGSTAPGQPATVLASQAGNEIRLEQPGTSSRVGLSYLGRNLAFDYTAPLGSWRQLTLASNGRTTTLYVNGIAFQTLPIAMPLPLAAFGSSTAFIDGDLDNVAVYDHALTAREIAENFRRGRRPR